MSSLITSLMSSLAKRSAHVYTTACTNVYFNLVADRKTGRSTVSQSAAALVLGAMAGHAVAAQAGLMDPVVKAFCAVAKPLSNEVAGAAGILIIAVAGYLIAFNELNGPGKFFAKVAVGLGLAIGAPSASTTLFGTTGCAQS